MPKKILEIECCQQCFHKIHPENMRETFCSITGSKVISEVIILKDCPLKEVDKYSKVDLNDA